MGSWIIQLAGFWLLFLAVRLYIMKMWIVQVSPSQTSLSGWMIQQIPQWVWHRFKCVLTIFLFSVCVLSFLLALSGSLSQLCLEMELTVVENKYLPKLSGQEPMRILWNFPVESSVTWHMWVCLSHWCYMKMVYISWKGDLLSVRLRVVFSSWLWKLYIILKTIMLVDKFLCLYRLPISGILHVIRSVCPERRSPEKGDWVHSASYNGFSTKTS